MLILLVNINQTDPMIETFGSAAGSDIQLSAPQTRLVPETGSSISMLLIGLGFLLRAHLNI